MQAQEVLAPLQRLAAVTEEVEARASRDQDALGRRPSVEDAFQERPPPPVLVTTMRTTQEPPMVVERDDDGTRHTCPFCRDAPRSRKSRVHGEEVQVVLIGEKLLGDGKTGVTRRRA